MLDTSRQFLLNATTIPGQLLENKQRTVAVTLSLSNLLGGRSNFASRNKMAPAPTPQSITKGPSRSRTNTTYTTLQSLIQASKNSAAAPRLHCYHRDAMRSSSIASRRILPQPSTVRAAIMAGRTSQRAQNKTSLWVPRSFDSTSWSSIPVGLASPTDLNSSSWYSICSLR